ncbi:MAG: gamma-glutamyltransferase [Thermoanaerobaculia bacterium]
MDVSPMSRIAVPLRAAGALVLILGSAFVRSALAQPTARAHAAILRTNAAPADQPYGASRTAVSRSGMVVTTVPEASRAGVEILTAGGNAIDAAIASAFALAVVYPPAGNLAGGGFLIARNRAGQAHALDFRETAPARLDRETFLALDPSASLEGGLAVATPGSVRGLAAAHQRLGKLSWARLLQPAVRLAREGFRVPAALTKELSDERALLLRHAESRRLFFPNGEPLAPGTLLLQPDLARTLEAIAAGGADAFHRGPIARRIVEFVRSEGGSLSEADLAGYAPVWRVPHVLDFERWRLLTMPLPSSGGFLLSAILGQLSSVRGSWREPAAQRIHFLAEAERRAFADRGLLGDADCHEIPLARLLRPLRLASLGTSIDPDRASRSDAIPGGSEPEERPQTTHLSVATANGDAVSITTTLNGTFGNGSVVPGVGVFLNNEMDDFATAPGRANLYDLIQGESNEVRAGARPLSSMTPTIVLEGNRPRFILGSPGGSTIPTTVLQVFLNAGPRGVALPAAVAAARLHHQHLPDRLAFEKGSLPAPLKQDLEARGHVLFERDAIGIVHAIEFRPDGSLLGVADPRGYGLPVGSKP